MNKETPMEPMDRNQKASLLGRIIAEQYVGKPILVQDEATGESVTFPCDPELLAHTAAVLAVVLTKEANADPVARLKQLAIEITEEAVKLEAVGNEAGAALDQIAREVEK